MTVATVDKELQEWLDNPPKSIAKHKKQRGDFEQWVYPDLITDTYTFIQGLPKAGKSLLSANLAASFSKGEPFLGESLSRPDMSKHVLVFGTEANLIAEWSKRVENVGGDVNAVLIDQIPTGQDVPTHWYIRAELGGIGLVIVDNTSGFTVDGGQKEDDSVTRLKKLFDPFIVAGVPVVVIHHFNKNGKAPTGSVQYQGMARYFLNCHKINDSLFEVKRPGGNFAPGSTLKLRRDEDLLTIEGETAPASGTEVSDHMRNSAVAMVDLAMSAPRGLTQGKVHEWIAERGTVKGSDGRPLSAGTIRNRLRDNPAVKWDRATGGYIRK